MDGPSLTLTGATTSDNSRRYDGPLVTHQTKQAAEKARLLHGAAIELWDISTLDDAEEMSELARIVAGRILALCPVPDPANH